MISGGLQKRRHVFSLLILSFLVTLCFLKFQLETFLSVFSRNLSVASSILPQKFTNVSSQNHSIKRKQSRKCKKRIECLGGYGAVWTHFRSTYLWCYRIDVLPAIVEVPSLLRRDLKSRSFYSCYHVVVLVMLVWWTKGWRKEKVVK